MNLSGGLLTRKALVLERQGLVGERLRRMLAEEGFATCWVDDMRLFHELRERLVFDCFVVGAESPEQLEAIDLGPDLKPLLLLVSLAEEADATRFRMAWPEAKLVDRTLRDPDALAGSFAGTATGRPAAPADLVRRTFGPFGLSERQFEVLRRALLGDTGAQIAQQLFISELTVRNHLHAIYEAVGVSGRRELLGRFVRGLVQEVGPARRAPNSG